MNGVKTMRGNQSDSLPSKQVPFMEPHIKLAEHIGRNKRLYGALTIAFVFFSSTLLQYLAPTFTIRGSLPPGMQVRGLATIVSNDFFCRSYDLASGSWRAGEMKVRVQAIEHAKDNEYVLELPAAYYSLACNWRPTGMTLYAAHPYYSDRNEKVIPYIRMGFMSEKEGVAGQAEMLCTKTSSYMEYPREYEPSIYCANNIVPGQEAPFSAGFTTYYPPGATDFTLNIRLEDGKESLDVLQVKPYAPIDRVRSSSQ